MTRGDMLARMTSAELSEWFAYFDLVARRQAQPAPQPGKTMTTNPHELKDSFAALARAKKPLRRKKR